MKRLSAEEIDYYAGHGEWRGKAGGYALQGYGEVYVRHIAGSYSNVVGLPLAETRHAAEGGGISALPEWLIERGIGEDPRGPGRGWRDRRGADPAATASCRAGNDARRAAVKSSGPQRDRATPAARNICSRKAPRASPRALRSTIEVTREAIPGAEPWKRPLARATDQSAASPAPLDGRGRRLSRARATRSTPPAGGDLIDEARTRHRRLRRRRAAHLADPGDDPDRRRRLLGRPTSWRSPARAQRRGRSAASTSAARSASICRPSRARPRARPRRRRSMAFCLSRSSAPRSTASASSRSSARARRASLFELASDRAGVRGPRPAPPRRARASGRQAARRASGGDRRARARIRTGSTRSPRQIGGAVSLRADPSLAISGGHAEPA